MLRQGALTLDARIGVDGWQKLVLLGALVFLPVPVLTASGLAVPIPSLVYQVASGLATRTQAIVVQLPGFEAVVADEGTKAREGLIRRSAAELPAATPATAIDGSPVESDGSKNGSKNGSRPGSKKSPVVVGGDAPARDQGSPAGTTPDGGSTGTPAGGIPPEPGAPPPPPPPPPPAPPPPPPQPPPPPAIPPPPALPVPPLPPTEPVVLPPPPEIEIEILPVPLPKKPKKPRPLAPWLS